MTQHFRTIEDYGVPMTSQKIVPGNTITSVSSGGYQYTERSVAYTSGGTTEIVAGDLIVGATSAATAVVVSITLTSGTWAGGNAAGVIRVKNQIGTFVSENIKVAGGTDDATIATDTTAISTDYRFKNCLAKTAIIQALAQTALVCFDGSKPDQTALKGWSVLAGGSLVVLDEAIQKIKVVDRVAASASTVFIQFYF